VDSFSDRFESSAPNAAVTFVAEDTSKFEGPLVSVLLGAAETGDDGAVTYDVFQSEDQEKILSLDSFFTEGGEEDDGSASSTNFNSCSMFIDSGNTCGTKCTKDSDCFKGGYVQCSKCGQYVGTQYYQRCYDPNPPAPAPSAPPTHDYFPEGGACKKKCTKNSDCRPGGFNPCGMCGKYAGTEMYHLCYSPN